MGAIAAGIAAGLAAGAGVGNECIGHTLDGIARQPEMVNFAGTMFLGVGLIKPCHSFVVIAFLVMNNYHLTKFGKEVSIDVIIAESNCLDMLHNLFNHGRPPRWH